MMMGSGAELELPLGFRFHPTDEELVNHYLFRKCAGLPISVPIIAEIDLYKYDPWQLPDLALYGEKEWYFFSPRGRKYPNGSRPNRAAGTGYWKATGTDKPIGKPKALGIKKALVFYAGKAPKGMKTNWIMHEYRPANVDRSPSSKNNLRLDDWVLCRLYNKKGRMENYYPTGTRTDQSSMKFPEMEERKPEIKNLSHQKMTLPPQPPMGNVILQMDVSESVPRLHTDSSSSEEHAVLSSPEFTGDMEVQSEPKWNELQNALDDYDFQFNFNYIDNNNNNNYNNNSSCFQDDPFGPQVQYQTDQLLPLQDLFMILQKPSFS